MRLEEMARALLDGYPGLAAVVDRDQVYRYSNRNHDLALAGRVGGVVGRSLSDLLGDEGAARVGTRLGRIFAGGEAVRDREEGFSIPGARADSYEAVYVPIRGTTGDVVAVLLLWQEEVEEVSPDSGAASARRRERPTRKDSQRQHQVEELSRQIRAANQQLALATLQAKDVAEQAERERERLAVILETMPGGICVTDAGGQIVMWNRGAEQIWGHRMRGHVGGEPRRQTLSQLQLDGKTPLRSEQDLLERVLAGETVIGDRFAIRRPDGTEVVVLANASPIRDEGAAITGAVLAFLDVTELYRLEQRRAEELTLVSHDLRSPLTAVSGQAQMIERMATRYGYDKIARWAELVIEGARRMDRMIEDLVDAARLEGGEMELKRQSVWLPRLAGDLVEQMAASFGERIVLDAPEQFPILELDVSRMERVITNLLTNALRHSPPDKPVHVRVWVEGDEARLSVADEGEGIGPDDLPNVFERRYRGRSSRGSGGLGLGLYICKGVVETHGGRIWVDTGRGRGATFHVALPL